MPPANSLQDTPSLSPVAPASTVQPSAPSTLPLLPNLTIDLVNRTEHEDEDVHDDNVNFLRTNSRSSPDFSLSHQRRRRQQQLAETESDQMDLDHRWGVGLNADFGSHIRWLDRHSDELSRLPNYEGRTPELRSLYGWAPDDVEDPAISLLQEWTADDTGVGHNSTSRRHARREPSGRASSHQPTDGGSNSNHRPIGTIVPTETLLQSVRRHPRFSRARTLHHYLLERDRDRDRESEDRDRSATRAYRFVPTSRSEIRNLSQHNDLRSRPSAHRQMCLDHPPSPRLKETIKYLDHLRDSCTLEERITSAAAIGYFHLDYFPRDEDDFILDTASIAPPAECSWLKPGMVFSGSQRAARTSSSIFSHHPHTPNDPVIVNGSEPGRPTVHTFSGRQYLPQNIYRLGSNKDENWPVKVTIHSINYNEMTLTGTMEAYNIPDKTTTTPDAHIITFLEGEIIDFNQYTLETGKFRADTETDSTYWRELQPFKDLTDDEMVKNLVSKKWITEELSNQWILMRWKEQCFVTPPRDSQSRQSLTISGFYYICLRRDSGHIEGLYYDPVSSPYQQLSLHPQSPRMICPSYKFR